MSKKPSARDDFITVIRRCGREVTLEMAEKKGLTKQFKRACRAGYFQQAKVFRPSWKATEALWSLFDKR